MRFNELSSNRVLIADDDPVIRHLVATVVKHEGCDVVLANDGREAYRILQTDSKFLAAILDICMPFLEGLDLVQYMRSEKRLRRIPVMIITAEENIKMASKSFAAGAMVFLPKPIVPEQLESAMRVLLHSQRTS